MTAEVSTTAWTGSGELAWPAYERPSGVHPPLDFAGYRSTALRHPRSARWPCCRTCSPR